MSKAKKWFLKRANHIKHLLQDSLHRPIEELEITDEATSSLSTEGDIKDDRTLQYVICFEGFRGISPGLMEYVNIDMLLIKDTGGLAVLHLSSFWFNKFQAKVAGNVTIDILLMKNIQDITVLEMFDSDGQMLRLFEHLKPSVIVQLVDEHYNLSSKILSAAKFLCTRAVEDGTIFDNIHLLNLYQHPKIYPHLSKCYEVKCKAINHKIQVKFFEKTLIVKEPLFCL